MAQLFADDIVALLRRETGDEPEGLSGDYFGSKQLKDVKWLPAYIYRTGTTVWAIELAREDYIAPVTLSEMQAARAKDANLTALVFVPRGESYEHLREVSNQTGLPLSVSTEAGYEILASTIRPGARCDTPPDKNSAITGGKSRTVIKFG